MRHGLEREFDSTVGPHVSLDTLDRYLRENGLHQWLAKEGPKLNATRAKERLAWALGPDWTEKDFQDTIWSDEYDLHIQGKYEYFVPRNKSGVRNA